MSVLWGIILSASVTCYYLSLLLFACHKIGVSISRYGIIYCGVDWAEMYYTEMSIVTNFLAVILAFIVIVMRKRSELIMDSWIRDIYISPQERNRKIYCERKNANKRKKRLSRKRREKELARILVIARTA